MTEERKHLNLDEFFGLDNPVIVTWKKETFELRRPASFDPPELHKWDELRKKVNKLREVEGELSENQSVQLGEYVAESIEMICSELSDQHVPFWGQVKILQFYNEEVTERVDVEAKKKAEE